MWSAPPSVKLVVEVGQCPLKRGAWPKIYCSGMLRLKFRCLGKSRIADAAEWIEFRGGQVCISGHRAPIAQYASGHWIYAGTPSSYLECRAMLFIHFEAPDLQRRCVVGPHPSYACVTVTSSEVARRLRR